MKDLNAPNSILTTKKSKGIIDQMATTQNSFTISFFCIVLLLSSVVAVSGQVDNPPYGIGTVSGAGAGNSPPPSQNQFSIQVGAFKTMSDAEKELSRVMTAADDSFYRYENTSGKGMWYRVYVGRYETRQEASQAAEQLKQQGVLDAYVIRKMNQNGFPKQAHAAPVTDLVRPEAEDPVTEMHAVRLSLLDAIQYSLAGNQEIKVVSYAPKQALAEVESVEAVYDPLLFAEATYGREPNLESSVIDIVTEDEGLIQAGIRKPLKTGGHLSTYLETRYGDLNNSTFDRRYKYIVGPTIELRQPLLNNVGSKKEQTAIKIANYRTNISQEEFRRKVVEITNSVATVYWKLFQFKALITIDQQNLDMAEEVHRREDVRLARGISQQLDVERARSNAQSRRSTLLRSQKEYRIAMDRLKLLLNGSQITIDSDVQVIPVDVPHTMPVNVDEGQAIETALANRPEIMKAKQELMIRQADETLSAHQRLPKLDAFGRYRLSGYGEDLESAGEDVSPNDDNAWEVGVSFEWAIGNRSATALYRKKKLTRLQANAQIERLEDDIKLDVKQALHTMIAASGEIEATRLAKAAAEKVVEGEFARFDIGQTSNLELLRAQDLLAINSRSFTRAIVDYNIAMHELMRAQGILPDGVAIEEDGR